MTVRAPMLDVDGVVVRHPEGRRRHDGLDADLGVDPGLLQRDFFRPHFTEIVVGRAKPDPAFFRAVERRTGFAPAELLLVDDAPDNVADARRAEWVAHLWTPQSRVADLPLA